MRFAPVEEDGAEMIACSVGCDRLRGGTGG